MINPNPTGSTAGERLPFRQTPILKKLVEEIKLSPQIYDDFSDIFYVPPDLSGLNIQLKRPCEKKANNIGRFSVPFSDPMPYGPSFHYFSARFLDDSSTSCIISTHKKCEIFEGRIINGFETSYEDNANCTELAAEKPLPVLTPEEEEKMKHYTMISEAGKRPLFWPKRAWDEESQTMTEEASSSLMETIVEIRRLAEVEMCESAKVRSGRAAPSRTDRYEPPTTKCESSKAPHQVKSIISLPTRSFTTDDSLSETDDFL